MTPQVLICGADGQLGRELRQTCPDDLAIIACSRTDLDITDASAITRLLDTHEGVRYVVNAAAYTAVDAAESDAAAARAINAIGPQQLAQACAARGLRLLHVSTDFVFDGAKGSPYQPTDTVNPLSVYGETKREGERWVLDSGADALIVRTGWVYSRHGGNFVKTMLRLLAERPTLTVVEDQVGTPTWARSLAQTCWQLLANPQALGVYHWSDAGVCSWYDFASEIRRLALATGFLEQAADITPIPASHYPTPASRPTYSVLDKTTTRSLIGRTGPHWSESLRLMLQDHQIHQE